KYSIQRHVAKAWEWYQKAKHGTRDLVIGELKEVNTFMKTTKEKVDRLYSVPWNLQVNDAWALGGIERRARFRAVSDVFKESLRIGNTLFGTRAMLEGEQK